jgi:hypothetical protein
VVYKKVELLIGAVLSPKKITAIVEKVRHLEEVQDVASLLCPDNQPHGTAFDAQAGGRAFWGGEGAYGASSNEGNERGPK